MLADVFYYYYCTTNINTTDYISTKACTCHKKYTVCYKSQTRELCKTQINEIYNDDYYLGQCKNNYAYCDNRLKPKGFLFNKHINLKFKIPYLCSPGKAIYLRRGIIHWPLWGFNIRKIDLKRYYYDNETNSMEINHI